MLVLPETLTVRLVAANLGIVGAFLALLFVLAPPPAIVMAASIATAIALFAANASFAAIERRARFQRVLAAVSRRSTGRNRDTARTWRAGLMAFMRTATRRVALLKDRQLEETRVLLVGAGFRSRDAVVVFSFFKLVAPLAFLGGSALYIFMLNPIGRGLLIDLAGVAAAALLGSKLPDFVVGSRRKKRLEAIRKELPDTLDMLVICAEAGLGSDAALKRVVAETGRRGSVLSEELGQLVLELSFMPERRQALEKLAERAPIVSVQSFSNTLIQAERYGTPLSRAFKVLSQEQRNERMMRAEEKAGRLPATMTVPMMIFILPALFIVLIGPAALDILDNFIRMND